MIEIYWVRLYTIEKKNKEGREIESGQGRSLGEGKRGHVGKLSHTHVGKFVSSRGKSQGKSPEVRACLRYLRNMGEGER